MDKRAEETYYCFRCGCEADDGLEYEVQKCDNCGEYGVLSILTAMDILNDLHLKGDLQLTTDVTQEQFDNEDTDFRYRD